MFDSEVFSDYYLAAFERDGKHIALELTPGGEFNADLAQNVLNRGPVVSFNGDRYDMPLLGMAMAGYSTHDIKRASDKLILQHANPWDVYSSPRVHRHIDLFKLTPGMASLKEYAARMHMPTLVEYTGDFNQPAAGHTDEIRAYCFNDLKVTRALLEVVQPLIDTRLAFDRSLESLNDAGIARRLLAPDDRGTGRPAAPFRYLPPGWMPDSPVLRAYAAQEFHCKDNGHTIAPVSIAGLTHNGYAFGLGGIHSTESKRAIRRPLVDLDVTSYYPSLLLNSGRFKHADKYREVLLRRIDAKRAGRDAEAAVFKIVLNSTYGLLSNMWSPLYDPALAMYVTITGQLALLMLIEDLERAGCKVVSANTDGVTLEPLGNYKAVAHAWEKRTGLALEEAHYTALFSRDVNSYVAIKEGGGVKRKGFFAPPSLAKNPAGDISITAAIEHLRNGTPICDTIMECADVRQFLFTRKVAGGAHLDGVPCGKVVRWYWSVASPGELRYVSNDYKVSDSSGGVPLVALPGRVPPDIDRARYITRAKEILSDVGERA